ncbi:hypothetical protein KW797_00495 [Candidatus Parcubacteria bacterium]|nr:hypothetical protein [Candidatus Parcubacteria bacterium]
MKNFFKDKIAVIVTALAVGVMLAVGGSIYASTITTISGTDTLTSTRAVLNTNFSNLNTDKAELSGGTFTGLVNLSAKASTTLFSAGGPIYIGTTSTTTIYGNATSTFIGGLNVTGGCLAVAGTCLSGSGTISASTATGQVPYYGSVGTTLTATSSIFIATNQKVGIGTTTPRSFLSVDSGTVSSIPLTISSGSATSYLVFTNTSMSDYTSFSSALGAEGYDLVFYVGNGTTPTVTMKQGGKVGIGTTTPRWVLQIATSSPSAQAQLALSDTSAGANQKHWLFSSMGGSLYIGTSTDAYGTSTPAALAISNAGVVSIQNTSSQAGTLLNISSGVIGTYPGTTCVNSGAVSLGTTGALTCSVAVSSGFTGTTTWLTNSMPYYNGTRLTESTSLTFDGSLFKTVAASSTSLSAYKAWIGGTATTTFLTTGFIGMGTSSPWAYLSVNADALTAPAFTISSSSATGNLFTVEKSGAISTCENQPATSTSMTIDWTNTCQQIDIRIGLSATTITFIKATTSQYAGSVKRVWVCNPNGTAGALTWAGVSWRSTTFTQTTTANLCDLWSFSVTKATSSSAYIVAGFIGTGQ